MKDIIETLANNDYVIIGLSVLLGILIILFFILLFSKNKKKQTEEVKEIDEQNIAGNNQSNDIDFDHNEYVKETTAEFELTPITDVKPAPDGFIPLVKEEETPAIDMKTKTIDDVPLADFNFDELSKSISQEIENLKNEEALMANEESTQKISAADAFKEIESVKPVEAPVTPNINSTVGVNVPNQTPKIEEFNEFIIDSPFTTDAPKVENTVNTQVNEVINQAPSEPVIKDEQTPLFARFNPETYDINKKD